MIKQVTIYGERCSGTNYLEQLLLSNFEVEITWEYGWKHFFGHADLSNSDDVLFIGIVIIYVLLLMGEYVLPNFL